MAIRELTRPSLAELAPLLEAVKNELRRPENQPTPSGAPIIFRDNSGLPQYSHYYVVWDRFAGYGDEIRTDIVFDAIKDVLGKQEAMKTVTAVGLTQEEAINMGFKI